MKKEEKIFYTAKTDIVFKEIFFKEDNRDLLLELLNTCLPIKVYEIKQVNGELTEGNIYTKRKILLDLPKDELEKLSFGMKGWLSLKWN